MRVLFLDHAFRTEDGASYSPGLVDIDVYPDVAAHATDLIVVPADYDGSFELKRFCRACMDLETIEQWHKAREDCFAAGKLDSDCESGMCDHEDGMHQQIGFLLDAIHDLQRRLGANPCATCWHQKDAHGDNPPSCYACSMMKLPAERADHAFK